MFGLSSLELRAVGFLAILAALAAGAYGLYLHGYHQGVAAENAHYAPLIAASQSALAAANAKTAQQEQAAQAVTNELRTQYAQQEQALSGRAAAAEQRITALLREHAASNPTASGSDVPPTAGGSDAGSATGEGHDATVAGGPGSRLAADAEACEHDADELQDWIDWYHRQAALMGAPTSSK